MIKVKLKNHDLTSSPEYLRKLQEIQREAGKSRRTEKLKGSGAASE
ncbi:hypothetical protein [Ammoniphilus oxalaticus]|nr:hypothetical protein [Ammoniphilus oxalaticus]